MKKDVPEETDDTKDTGTTGNNQQGSGIRQQTKDNPPSLKLWWTKKDKSKKTKVKNQPHVTSRKPQTGVLRPVWFSAEKI